MMMAFVEVFLLGLFVFRAFVSRAGRSRVIRSIE